MIRKILNRIIDKRTYMIIEKNARMNAISNLACKCNYEAFEELRAKYVGKEVVICGAGPSLQNYKPIEGAIHIALNRALLFDKVKFDYFFADDWDGIYFIQDDIIKYDCKKYLGDIGLANEKVSIREDFRNKLDAKRYYTDIYICRNGYKSQFVTNIAGQPIGGFPNIAIQVMQIALFMNPKTIYLVGCDASSGHFVDGGLSKEKIKQQDEDVRKCVSAENVFEIWTKLKEFAHVCYPETKIVSINPVGLKGIFEDIYQ